MVVKKKKGATKDDGKSGKKEIPRNLCEQHVSTRTHMHAHKRKKNYIPQILLFILPHFEQTSLADFSQFSPSKARSRK